MARRFRVSLCLASVWVLGSVVGCTAARDGVSAGVARRDSAGVAIVEHSAAALAALPTWTIDLATGASLIRDTAAAQFTTILDAAVRRDGSVVVVDQRRRDLVVFGADGALRSVLARAGQGPGEIGFVSRLLLMAGDSLAVADGNNRRLTVFSPDDRFARQQLFPRFADGSRVRIVTPLADGRLLGTLRSPWVEAPEQRDSVYRTPFAIVAFRMAASADSAVADSAAPPMGVDTVAVVPDAEAYRANTTENGETRADEYPLRFGRGTVLASNGRRAFVATNTDAEIRVYGPGGLERIMRSAQTPRPVTADDRARLEGDVMNEVRRSGRPPAMVAEVEAMVKGWRYAATHNYVDRLLPGDDGTLWGEAPWVLADDARRYLVYDSTGVAIARVELPPRVTVLRASARELLGVWKDEDDVPQLRRWAIVGRRQD